MKPVTDISRPTSWKDQRGAVVVEMAIILPLFAILMLAAFEFGSTAHAHQALQNAARERARFSANPTGQTCLVSNPAAVLAAIQNRVVTYLQGEKITVSAANVTVNQSYPITIGGLTVMGSRVTVNYQRSLIFPGITGLIPSAGTMQLQGNAVFRNFYSCV